MGRLVSGPFGSPSSLLPRNGIFDLYYWARYLLYSRSAEENNPSSLFEGNCTHKRTRSLKRAHIIILTYQFTRSGFLSGRSSQRYIVYNIEES